MIAGFRFGENEHLVKEVLYLSVGLQLWDPVTEADVAARDVGNMLKASNRQPQKHGATPGVALRAES